MRMKASGPGMRYVQERTQFIPDGGHELGPMVRGYLGRNSMRALAQSVGEMEDIGSSSGQCEVLLRMVNNCADELNSSGT